MSFDLGRSLALLAICLMGWLRRDGLPLVMGVS